ncbi:MAG: radical SAM protein [Candidatus Falkowbacteria bacterium]
MPSSQKEYQFIENTTSLCSTCLKRLDAKIIEKEGKIFVLKYCIEHGEQEEIIEEDAAYYHERMMYTKPGTVSKVQTDRKLNCPYDCGLCPEHEQHTCIGLIEVTNACDLGCPTCYAKSGSGEHLPMEKIDEMLEFFLESEFGSAEILQISGGEPTTHPQIIDIIKLARSKSIKYVMLNTNGLRLAEDEEFVKELSQFSGGFEIYLQFDGFADNIYKHLRGRELSAIKKKAIDNLTKYKIPITLVSTIERGVNDQEIGKIVEFGINTKYIRGVNFQPVAFFGRLGKIDTANRITITGIIECIEKQTSGMIGKNDFIPLPCNVDRVAITYLYRQDGEFIPLTRNLDIRNYLPAIRNTFKFDPEDFLKDLTNNLAGGSGSCCNYLSLFNKFKKMMPVNYLLKSKEEKMEYVSENTFRISVTSFVDKYNFDMKSMKKECVHIITPDLKKIPFSAYNMLHRK